MTAVSSGERAKAQAIAGAELDRSVCDRGGGKRQRPGVVVELRRPDRLEAGSLGLLRELDVLALRGQLEQETEHHRASRCSRCLLAGNSTSSPMSIGCPSSCSGGVEARTLEQLPTWARERRGCRLAPVRIGVSLPNVGLDHGKEMLLPVAEAAERLGFDSVFAAHHVVLPYERESEYPYQRSGTEVAMSPGHAVARPARRALARARRSPTGSDSARACSCCRTATRVNLAAEAAALDVLSDGRFVLGVGAGWMREEFAALGLDPPSAGRAPTSTSRCSGRSGRRTPRASPGGS